MICNTTEWETKEVFEAHEYDKNISVACDHHDDFVHFLELNNIKSPTILDIGCCNGRVLNSFNEKQDFRVYHGLDINTHAIDVARNHWKNKKGVSFEVFDVVKQDLSELPLREFDVAYLDSTLAWFPNWRAVLDTLLEYVPIVYCNRTIWMTDIYLDAEDGRLKKMDKEEDMRIAHRWSGMKGHAMLNFVNEGYIDFLADKHKVTSVKYREDEIDGNWFDLYAHAHTPKVLEQQEILHRIAEGKYGKFMMKRFIDLYLDPDEYVMYTGKGVWLKPTQEVLDAFPFDCPRYLHGGHIHMGPFQKGEDAGNSWKKCALVNTKNRKLIFFGEGVNIEWAG